ncbi:nucleoside 2-deoxyribosyltransferase domain-containing protein [Streptomyces sp. NBC_00984]|uniref:nucleoside 2-deoxyribosyltransferase domain-containing protein n=1 Tax=Streptomyces sp. NBC_00984 TaxID=2903700 RepID=UPI00386580A8|nr:nucleoside 2-deoxyribosyltransferase domain-containing protein [Streptomyces sp. NBC_00984]
MMKTAQVRVIESMQEYVPRAEETKVFLAGGMHNCPDWRYEAITAFKQIWFGSSANRCSLALLSPRRVIAGSSGFNESMVAWEYRHLALADLVLFWFPSGNAARPEQPIALYELGAAAAAGRAIAVGVENGYRRRSDVVAQLRCARPGLPVHSDLLSTVGTAVEALGAKTHPLRSAS